jgi:outer membrane biosynthesis protein TonB
MVNLVVQEREVKKKSALVTFVLLLLLVLLSIFWVVVTNTIPPKDEEKYEVQGRMDFGNLREGSSNINNKQKPAESETQVKTAAAAATSPKPQRNSPDPVITKNEPSEITAPKNEPVQQKSAAPSKKAIDNDALFDKGESGANHGNSNSVGDRGRQDSPVLDPLGSFSWGEGGEGLNGRHFLGAPFPTKHGCQEEGKITFAIVVDPTGRVKNVVTKKYSGQHCLKAFMEKFIREKWKFSPINENKDQVIKVTFQFKLK